MNCRHCSATQLHCFLDLGHAPPSNAYLTETDLHRVEKYYPLRVMVCTQCWLVQTQDFAAADELFSSDYAYFSSTSVGWLAHARNYTIEMTQRLGLNADSHVMEIASNDGYLLKNFVAAGIPCLGIEPTASTADAAEKLGIPVIREFFGADLGRRLAQEGRQADLVIGNNVYAHVPDINDFTLGLKAALKPGGIITLEFPHLLRLITEAQFDTIYHEHFSYLTLSVVARIFGRAGLAIFDVETLNTHGGSLRVFGCHIENCREVTPAVREAFELERDSGLQDLHTYLAFQARAEKIKLDFLSFLVEQKRNGKQVAAYGAAAKGNTLMNFSGIRPDLLPFVADAAPSKQGKYMPGSHLPIVPPSYLRDFTPDYLIIFPWNIAEEVRLQNADLSARGTQFVRVVPELTFV
jgi:SAM-dependent methyltransferase